MILGWWPFKLSIMATDSRAASSCRHSTTKSTCAIRARLASGSLRLAGSMLTTSMAGMWARAVANLQAGGACFAVNENLVIG